MALASPDFFLDGLKACNVQVIKMIRLGSPAANTSLNMHNFSHEKTD